MQNTRKLSRQKIVPPHLPTIPREFAPLVTRLHAGLGSLKSRPPHDILAVRMYAVHWAVDGLLRLVRADRNPPPEPEREAAYRAACAEFDVMRKGTLWPLLANIYHADPANHLGVWHIIGLLVLLELLNTDCRRRAKYQAVRRNLETWPEEKREAQKRLLALTRNWKVSWPDGKAKPLEKWFAFYGAPPMPALQDEKSSEAAAWHEHDARCLDILGDLQTMRTVALKDIAAGDVDIPPLPSSECARRYPVPDPWWNDVSARVCDADIRGSLALFYPHVDDTLEKYGFRALETIKATGEAKKPDNTVSAAATLSYRFGYAGFVSTRTDETDEKTRTPFVNATDPADTPIDTAPLKRRVTKEWGRRMWRGIEARSQGSTLEEAAKEAKISRRTFERRLELVAEWAKEMDLR